jgi:hypothetical protein
MNKIIEAIHAILGLLGHLSLDIESMPDGKIKICFIIDPKEIK